MRSLTTNKQIDPVRGERSCTRPMRYKYVHPSLKPNEGISMGHNRLLDIRAQLLPEQADGGKVIEDDSSSKAHFGETREVARGPRGVYVRGLRWTGGVECRLKAGLQRTGEGERGSHAVWLAASASERHRHRKRRYFRDRSSSSSSLLYRIENAAFLKR